MSLTRKLAPAVDGSPTEVEGEVLVGGWSWLETGEFLTEESEQRGACELCQCEAEWCWWHQADDEAWQGGREQ